jgi:hypothetical protein
MASKKQIRANRANAKRSTGPKTPAGKRNSSKNALKHGLSAARDIVIFDEDPLEFASFRDAVTKACDPIDVIDLELADDLAGLFWRRRRIPKLEAAQLSSSLDDTFNYIFQMADPPTRMKVAQRLGQLQRARKHGEGGEVGFLADLGQALCNEMPEVMAGVIEAEKNPETDKWLTTLGRHETNLRNGICRILALLHARRAARFK